MKRDPRGRGVVGTGHSFSGLDRTRPGARRRREAFGQSVSTYTRASLRFAALKLYIRGPTITVVS